MPAAPLYVGVDVSQRELVVAYFQDLRPRHTLANTPAAITRWLDGLPAGCQIGMEATGTYHRRLADLAHAAGHIVFVLNPKQVAHYLRSQRQRGKTDLLDAQGIARFVHHETDHCHPYQPLTAHQQRMHELLQRRALLTRQRAALRMSWRELTLCPRAFADLLKSFSALIAQLDAALEQLICADTALAERRQRLMSINGFGPLISAAVARRLSTVPYRNSDALVAAFGLDPRPMESGEYRGRRRLSKCGNPEERRLLYLAGVSTARSPLWQALRERLSSRGLSKTAINCIVARKLLRIAFAIWHSKATFSPQMLTDGGCGKT